MVIGRGFAEPVVHRFSPAGVLLISAIFATAGLYMLGHTQGNMLYAGALVFGMGVCYFWPTMIGFVAEYLPKTGAVGLNLMGGAGMFAVSLYMIFMGSRYDAILLEKLPAGANLEIYNAAAPGSAESAALEVAKKSAGPDILNTTMFIPAMLTVAFLGLFFYMRKQKAVSVN
jgi:hypothetical protein